MTWVIVLTALLAAVSGAALCLLLLSRGPLRYRLRGLPGYPGVPASAGQWVGLRGLLDRLRPEQSKRREVVIEFMKTLPTILDYRLLVDSLPVTVSRAFDCRYACLFLKNERGDGYSLLTCSAPGDALADEGMVVAEDNPVVCRLRERAEAAPWVISGRDSVLRGLPDKDTRVFRMLGARLLAPLYLREKLLGFLLLSRRLKVRTYSRADRELLTSLCFQAASALENARLYTLARTEAITDALTRLYNRRFFEEALEQELARHWRYGHKFALLLIDVDRFKLYNDRKGHLAGDLVLTQLGRILREELRAVDIAARWGGEEFAVLLPETGMEQALAIAERLREVVETDLAPREEGVEPLTVSIGVSGCPLHGVTRDELLLRADQALYRAKDLGRNVVCIYPVAAVVDQPPVYLQ